MDQSECSITLSKVVNCLPLSWYCTVSKQQQQQLPDLWLCQLSSLSSIRKLVCHCSKLTAWLLICILILQLSVQIFLSVLTLCTPHHPILPPATGLWSHCCNRRYNWHFFAPHNFLHQLLSQHWNKERRKDIFFTSYWGGSFNYWSDQLFAESSLEVWTEERRKLYHFYQFLLLCQWRI